MRNANPQAPRGSRSRLDCRRLMTPVLVVLSSTCTLGLLAAERRAKHPDWQNESAADVFFDNAFTDALVGPRPGNLSPTADSTGPRSPMSVPVEKGNEPQEGVRSGHRWQELIRAETIEDEIKRLSRDLDSIVTTPASFAGQGYQDARREFTMLAVLFGVIHEYHGEVRWKEDAGAARDNFSHAAAIAKVGTIQVYQAAKNRKLELQDLVRGDSLPDRSFDKEKSWGECVDRSPIMQRMKLDFREKIARWSANPGEFKSHREELAQRAELLGMLARALTTEGMEDGDDETYAGYCHDIEKATQIIKNAIQSNDANAARSATSEISQACDACHEAYRG